MGFPETFLEYLVWTWHVFPLGFFLGGSIGLCALSVATMFTCRWVNAYRTVEEDPLPKEAMPVSPSLDQDHNQDAADFDKPPEPPVTRSRSRGQSTANAESPDEDTQDQQPQEPAPQENDQVLVQEPPQNQRGHELLQRLKTHRRQRVPRSGD